MKKLTLDILDAISPEYSSYQSITPITARYNEYTSQFSLNNQGWEAYYRNISAITFNWQEIKYEDVVNKVIKINDVIPKEIGVYLFIVRPLNMVNGLPRFVYYVGIAGANGSKRALNERLKDYFNESHLKKRDTIRIMIHKHYKNVFINYSSIKVASGITLEEIEKSLIGFFGTHLLANRDDIPIDLKPQSKAYNV